MATTSTATASISRCGWRRWPHPARSASRARCGTMSATGSPTPSRTWGSRVSRTSPGRSGSMRGALRAQPVYRPRACHPRHQVRRLPSRRACRSSCCRSPISANDPEQLYFADGITEDLTTDLSRLAGTLVISRNTAFTYQGKRIDTKQIGCELCVRYVLEGSVWRSGNKVRINAQLIDAETDAHLWAERF